MGYQILAPVTPTDLCYEDEILVLEKTEVKLKENIGTLNNEYNLKTSKTIIIIQGTRKHNVQMAYLQ